MSNTNSHPSLIYRGAPGTQTPQVQPKQPKQESKKESTGIVKKDIVIPETMANKAIKIGASGVIGVAIGFLTDRIIKNKPITWFVLGSAIAIGFEFIKKD
jgi:hypothetical protein